MKGSEAEFECNHSKCINDALTRATRICNEKSLRLTYLRKRVLELIWLSHKPIGAYTMIAELSKEGRNVAPPTVYRSLDFLLEQGFIHRLTSLNAFVGCPNPGHSIYCQFLICSECSHVSEVQDINVIEAILDCTDSKGFKVQGEIVEIKGTCKNCQNKSSN